MYALQKSENTVIQTFNIPDRAFSNYHFTSSSYDVRIKFYFLKKIIK